MKPKNIFLVRHGQSEANVDKTIYTRKPDYAVLLTEEGVEQAKACGKALAKLTGGEDVAMYYSSFFRARQTADIILENIPSELHRQEFIKECSQIREQEWRTGLGVYLHNVEQIRDTVGHFYYRFDNGESCANVFDRVSIFIGALHRDFEKPNFPKNLIISGHGKTNRVIVMRYLHKDIEFFEKMKNPPNCAIWHLQLGSNNKYELMTEIPSYESVGHEFIYPFDGPTKRASTN